MFGKTFPLFKVFGVQVQADLSWLIIVILITWSLAVAVFPAQYKELPPADYWAMGVAGAIGLFGSILLHELAHSVVALRCGIPMKRITLFIFGGVAEMGEEPKTPMAEFFVAIAGPIMSVFIAVACLGFGIVGASFQLPDQVTGVAWYLGMINGIVVIFNMVPAFPLDGGRVLRALLWRLRGDLTWATRITASLGSAFGMFLIFMGVFGFVTGNVIGGVWQLLIGLFLRGAATMSYQHVLVKNALRGETVARFMHSEVVTVPASITVSELVEDYVYRYHHKLFPVTEDGRLVGCVTTRNIKGTPRDDWHRTSVGAIMSPCSADNTITAETEAAAALARMSQQGNSRLMVVDADRLVGVVTLKDLIELIALKLELEEGEPTPGFDVRKQGVADERNRNASSREMDAAQTEDAYR